MVEALAVVLSDVIGEQRDVASAEAVRAKVDGGWEVEVRFGPFADVAHILRLISLAIAVDVMLAPGPRMVLS